MIDESDLIRRICETPDDDTPRLIYADWLDDRGQSKKANAIRAHIEAETKHPGQAVVTGRAQYAGEYLSEYYRLLSVVTNYTSGLRAEEVGHQLSDLMSRNMVDWRRGFIEEITLPLAVFVGGECTHCRPSQGGCRRCAGKVPGKPRRMPGIAKELFEKWPITKVTIVNMHSEDDWRYVMGSIHPVYYGRQLAGLPPLSPTRRP